MTFFFDGFLFFIAGEGWLPAIALIFIAAVTAYAVGQIREPTVAAGAFCRLRDIDGGQKNQGAITL